MKIVHVLGSDLSHHNITVLRFFNDTLYPLCDGQTAFMVVAKDTAPYIDLANLSITFFANKKAIAEAVKQKAKADRDRRFFFHGQFNPYIWIALLLKQIQPQQAYWHIWGADLYEDASGWKYKFFYFMRRFAYKKIGLIYATKGDLDFFAKKNPQIKSQLLYFPTKMNPELNNQGRTDSDINLCENKALTILVGNSGDKSNRHIEALESIYQAFGKETNVIIPMGYPANNQSYIAEVATVAVTLFDKNAKILTDKIEFQQYLTILRSCNVAYFIFQRQQAIGTICLLIQFNIPFVLSEQNTFIQDLTAQNIPVLNYKTQLSKAQILQAHQQLRQVEKENIIFFNPNYIDMWRHVLNTLAEKR